MIYVNKKYLKLGILIMKKNVIQINMVMK